jgi:hypothetical protein
MQPDDSYKRKKEFELHMLRRFISHESHGLRIKTIEETETPDFIIRELNMDVSIELTRLILPDLMKEEKFQDKLVSMVWKKFKQKHPDKLQVLVNFSNNVIRCAANEIDNYVDQLLGIVESIFIPNKRFEFRVSSVGRARPINNFIDSIVVSNDLYYDNWQPFGAYMVRPINKDWLKNIIIEKEKKIKTYKATFDQNWLLLLANFGHESSTHDFDYLKLNEFQTDFDRVYLYKYFDDDYSRLV